MTFAYISFEQMEFNKLIIQQLILNQLVNLITSELMHARDPQFESTGRYHQGRTIACSFFF